MSKAQADPTVTYPRDVPVLPGMPPGWKGVEKLYGPSSKTAGQVYVRYSTLDGKLNSVMGPKQVMEIHCKTSGEDPVAMYAEYMRLMKERQKREAEDKKPAQLERARLAKLKEQAEAEAREVRIARFRERFGSLSGPLVFGFPGWITRWLYREKCDQTAVEYIDPEGNSWKLLKDLESAFQIMIDNGTGGHLHQMIETAKASLGPERQAEFARGPVTAKENNGIFQVTSEGASVFDLEWLEKEKFKRKAENIGRRQERRIKAKLDIDILTDRLFPQTSPQSGWAAPSGNDEIEQAFEGFQKLLVARGFGEHVPMVAITGASGERKYHPRIAGIYYQLPEVVGGKPCYQRLLHFPDHARKLGCDGVYLLFSNHRQRWELSTRPTQSQGRVIGHSDQAELCGPWRLQDGQADYVEDSGMTVVIREVESA